MNELSRRLGGYIVEDPKQALTLSAADARLYRTLQTEAERYRACRAVEHLHFRVRMRNDHPVFLAILEGRDAASVCKQIARRFESQDGVQARVVSTRSGSRVVIKLEG